MQHSQPLCVSLCAVQLGDRSTRNLSLLPTPSPLAPSPLASCDPSSLRGTAETAHSPSPSASNRPHSCRFRNPSAAPPRLRSIIPLSITTSIPCNPIENSLQGLPKQGRSPSPSAFQSAAFLLISKSVCHPIFSLPDPSKYELQGTAKASTFVKIDVITPTSTIALLRHQSTTCQTAG